MVVGGGRVAARKVKGLLASEASVRVVSPDLGADLDALARGGAIKWSARSYRSDDLEGAFLVIAATDDEAVQKQVFIDAEKKRLLVNVADVPARCNFILPALLRRGDLCLAVSTGGKSPALAKVLRKELEKRFGPEYKILVDFLGELRPAVIDLPLSQLQREELFHDLIHPQIIDWIRAKQWDIVEKHVVDILGKEAAGPCMERLQGVLRQDY